MTTLPPLLTRSPKLGVNRLRSPAHLAWVRKHACCVPECDGRPIVAAHVRTGTLGGMGLKPGDDWTISLCAGCHHEQHQIGEAMFERAHGIDMKALALEFAARSPHRKKLGR